MPPPEIISQGMATGAFLLIFIILTMGVRRFFINRFHNKLMESLNTLTSNENQRRKDVWNSVKQSVASYLEKRNGKMSLRTLKKDYAAASGISNEGTRELRDALKELSMIPEDAEQDQ